MLGRMKNWIDIPPVWLGLFIAATWVLPRPWASVFPAGAPGLGWGLIGGAVLLMGWAALLFPLSRTSVIPHRKPQAIITGGPYRLSRNPIYLADAMALLGAALVMKSLIGLALVPAFVALITRRFIHGEEARLRAAFPDAAEEFLRRTRRWL
jgi:protein-S-isoprenylcysteine O-methyltransferase Ste14